MAALLASAGLLASCGDSNGFSVSREEPVRRATFQAMIALDVLLSCPAGARQEGLRRAERYQAERYGALTQLGAEKGAGHAIWLGENDHAALAPHGERETCLPGEEGYRAALAGYSASLDALAGRIAEYRP